jgi:glycine/D-amino acid oxidase-like deaminating enzyme
MSTGKAEQSPPPWTAAPGFGGGGFFQRHRKPNAIQRNAMNRTHPHICVIGGGFTGAAAAIPCLRRLDQPFRLTIVEPSETLGQGVAFGGYQPLHLLNVRTRDLSIHSDRPHDFLNWVFSQLDQGENDPGLQRPRSQLSAAGTVRRLREERLWRRSKVEMMLTRK